MPDRSVIRRRALAWAVLLGGCVAVIVVVGIAVSWPTAGVVGALVLAVFGAIPAIRTDMRAAVSGDAGRAKRRQVTDTPSLALDGERGADAASRERATPAQPEGEVAAATAHGQGPTARGPWDSRLNPVEAALARWITGPASIRNIAERSGLTLARIPQEGTPVNMWHAVLGRAVAEDKVDSVLTFVLEEESTVDLRHAVEEWRTGR